MYVVCNLHPGHNTCCSTLESLHKRRPLLTPDSCRLLQYSRRLLMNACTSVFAASKVNDDLTVRSWHKLLVEKKRIGVSLFLLPKILKTVLWLAIK